MWKHKRGSRWKNNFKKHTKEMKDKMQVEEEKEKKKSFIKKKSLMATWEDLDLSSSKDEDEEANLCLTTNTSLEDEDDEESLSRTSFKFLNPVSWIQRIENKIFKTVKRF
ncbi:hypothetical protein CR513_28545, partial [Mucuna pruriens]